MSQVSMIAVRALATAVENAGGERTKFLAEAGLSAAQLADVTARITLAEYDRVRRAALSASGDPALGLHMGGRASMGKFDALGALAEHSSCLRAALEVSIRYSRVFMEGPQLELQETGELATIRCTQLLGEAPVVRLTSEFVASSLLHLMRCFVGSDAQPRAALFPYRAPAHRAEYTRVFGGRERFEQAFTGIAFDREWLERSHAYRSPELHALLRARADQLLASVDRDAPTAERVKRVLASESMENRPTMDAVARTLGMSARSLRRRLHEESASFDDLVEKARAVRAKHLLADARQSVQAAAYAMGFDTPAAFSRAFRRWTGMAPTAFRAAIPQ